MTTELVPLAQAPATALPAVPRVTALDLAEAYLATFRNPHTRQARRKDLDDFARFLGAPVAAAAAALVAGTHGQANALALGYRADLNARGLSSATVNRRLAALRGLVRTARTLGIVPFALDVANLEAAAYLDTRGPGSAGWARILAVARAEAAGGRPKAVRDLAVARLLFDAGLRRGEVVGLDVEDLDLAGDPPGVWVLGKRRLARERITLAVPTAAAVGRWLDVRGPAPGPLLVRLDPGALGGERLTGEAVRLVVAALGRRAGVGRPVRPHGLRHAAITEVLDRNGGDVRAAARFSRHKYLRVLTRYDDNRADLAGAMTRLIARE